MKIRLSNISLHFLLAVAKKKKKKKRQKKSLTSQSSIFPASSFSPIKWFYVALYPGHTSDLFLPFPSQKHPLCHSYDILTWTTKVRQSVALCLGNRTKPKLWRLDRSRCNLLPPFGLPRKEKGERAAGGRREWIERREGGKEQGGEQCHQQPSAG